MSLLAIGLGLTGFKMKQAYDEQKFLTEVQQLTSTLQTAQDLMLILDAEVDVVFFEDFKEKKIGYQLVSEGGRIPKQWLALIGQRVLLNKIRYLSVNGMAPSELPTLKLHFYSRGLAMSVGKVVVSRDEKLDSQDSSRSYQIVMHGYPHYIKSEAYQSKSEDTSPLRGLFHKAALYPDEVWEDLRRNEPANKEKAT